MATQAFWKGYLKLSLVTCPVSMTPATSEASRVRFHTLDRRTGNRVVARYVDAVTGDPVDEADEARGYPTGETDFVLLDDDDLDAVALESTRTIDIETFVPAASIGWVWYDRPHYLLPTDAVGEEAYAVIRDAMAATATIGIARLVLYRRERAVLLKPRDDGIVVWTLRYGDEVRDPDPHFAAVDGKPDPALLRLVTRLIDERTREWSTDMVEDPVQARLLDLIAAKKKGRRRRAQPKPARPAPAGNVVSIMDALKRSIAAERKTKPR